MNPTYIACRLVGGRYDGDEARIPIPLPPTIYAAACPLDEIGHADLCPQGGVHWFYEPVLRADAVPYARDRFVDGCQLYRCDGLGERGGLHVEHRDLVPA